MSYKSVEILFPGQIIEIISNKGETVKAYEITQSSIVWEYGSQPTQMATLVAVDDEGGYLDEEPITVNLDITDYREI